MLNSEQKEGIQSSQVEGDFPEEEPKAMKLLFAREVSVNDCRPAQSNDVIQATSPAFGISAASAVLAQEQQSHQNPPSSFTANMTVDVNQNSSQVSSRQFQSLLTPTLFMKMPGSTLPLVQGAQRSEPVRSSFQTATANGSGSGTPAITELNCISNAANSEKNTQNDGGNQRMSAGPQFAVPSNSGFTVLGSMQTSQDVNTEQKFESPPRQKSFVQRSLTFMQQHGRSSPQLITTKMRQQTTPNRESKVSQEAETQSGSKNKENINSANFGGHSDRYLVEEVKGSDVRVSTLSMQMFISPDKKTSNVNQIMMQNESPAADSCQSAQNAFANLNICNTAGSSNKYQSALAGKNGTSRILNIQSGAIFDIQGHAAGAAASSQDHATSNNDFLNRHLTTSPMFKGFLGLSPKNSPIQHRINLQSRDLGVTSLNMKLENHAHDQDLLPSQIMINKNNERSSASFIGFEGVPRIYNPDLEDPVLTQLQNLGPTASGTKATKTHNREELSGRRLFHSPKNSDPLDIQNSAAADPCATSSARKHYRYSQNATSSVSSQIGFKHIHQNKGTRIITKVLSNQLEDIVEEPIRMQGMDLGGQIINNNSLNQPLFSNHHHPFDNLMISNNSAQMRLNNLIDGPNSGDSGRKMRSFLSTIPDIVHSSGGATGEFNNSHLQGNNIVHRLDNDFTMAEINNTSGFGQEPIVGDNHYTEEAMSVGYGYPQNDNHFSFNANVVHHLSDHTHPQFHYGGSTLQHNHNHSMVGQYQGAGYGNSSGDQQQRLMHGKAHHGLRSKNQSGLPLTRSTANHHHHHPGGHNSQHNTSFPTFNSTQTGYDISRKTSGSFIPNQVMTYSSGFQGEQQIQTHSICHKCHCGGSFTAPGQPQMIQSYHNQTTQLQYEGQQLTPNHVHHRAHPGYVSGGIGSNGKSLRHNHPLNHLGPHQIPQRSMSMKTNHRGPGGHAHIPHPPMRGKKIIHKNAAAALAANQSIQMPSFDLKNSNFYNANIQMNVYIPSPPETNSANSSQATTNLGHQQASQQKGGNSDQKNVEPSNEEASHTQEQGEFNEDVKMQTASKTAPAQMDGSQNKKQVSMSSNKKNSSGLKKRLYPQFLDSSNQKNITTPSTNCGLLNSTSKSNQKSTLKKRQQEIHNQNVISQFDISINQAIMSQQNVSSGNFVHSENENKFQTPKGPNFFHQHHNLSVKQTSSSGDGVQGMLSTPDYTNEKDMIAAGSSTQKNQQAVFQHSIANHQRHQLILGGHSDSKSSALHQHHVMESGEKSGTINNQVGLSGDPPIVPPRPSCNCKRSKCIKLYCDCFALGLGCGPDCNCQDCCNTDGKEERNAVMESILERNPQAFKPKITEETGYHSKGCHCKKSGCLKKYCECFQSGVLCTDKCVCDGCQNCEQKGRGASGSKISGTGGHVHPHSEHFEGGQMMIENEENAQDITDTKCNEEIKVGESAPGLKINQNQKIQNYVSDQMQHNSLSRFESTPVAHQKNSDEHNHDMESQFSSCDPLTRKVRSTRHLTQDFEKLILSEEKMATPEDNLESKNSARKRRDTDLNSSQILQLTQTPISKKTKKAQSSAKAVSKTDMENRISLKPMVNEDQNMLNMSQTKKAPNKQKSPIKNIQNDTQIQVFAEDVPIVTSPAEIVASQQQVSQKNVGQPPVTQSPQTQQAMTMINSAPQQSSQQQQQSCITTRSKRKQLEAAQSISNTQLR